MVGEAPDVRELADLHPAALDAERNRLGRVVRNAERHDLNVINREWHTGRYGHNAAAT